jgi:prevent-host-death family protein
MVLRKKPVTETMSVSESRKQYSDILNRVYREGDQVIIEKNGIPVAAIVPVSAVRTTGQGENGRERLLGKLAEADRESGSLTTEELEREGAEAMEILERIQAGFKGIPEDELEREITKAIAEVNADYAAKRQSQR